jgi:hypothetical protein
MKLVAGYELIDLFVLSMLFLPDSNSSVSVVIAECGSNYIGGACERFSIGR